MVEKKSAKAKAQSQTTESSKSEKPGENATVEGETPTQSDSPETPSETDESAEEGFDGLESTDEGQDLSTSDQTAPDTPSGGSEPTEPALETRSEPDPAPIGTSVEKRPSALPMLLGGVLAGAIGFGAAYFWQSRTLESALRDIRQDVSERIDAQSSQISSLSKDLSKAPSVSDLNAIRTTQSELVAASQTVSDRFSDVERQLADLEARLTDVEKRPVTEAASDAAVAAYERELKALQDTMAAQRAEIEAMATQAQAKEENAQEIAQATIRRAALTRIQTALDAGTGFAPALADLEVTGLAIPEALRRVAETGVPSLSELQTEFPEFARAALAASRETAQQDGESGGFGAFLKTQLGARSLEPREGNDPDAILSRAEAAAQDGRLTDALAEIEALPDEGRAALSDWVAKAADRLEAIASAETLGQELN